MISIKEFGKTKDGKNVLMFTIIDNTSYVNILNYGGIVQSLVLQDKDNKPTDIVLGYNTIEEYEDNDGYLGAIIGRFGNRIEKGILNIDNKEYKLYCNNDGNHLHGGKEGFNKKIWDYEIVADTLVLHTISYDMEENYPGNLDVSVTYRFKNNELTIEYNAISDKKTVINLTNHTYFNLDGEGSGNCLNNILKLISNYYIPTDDKLIPHGDISKVINTPFDFNKEKEIGKDIDCNHIDLIKAKGYDHCYLLNNNKRKMIEYAIARSKKTGIKMRCFTNLKGVQLYSGNFLSQQGKSTFYDKRAGFCLETEDIPNNVNVKEYSNITNSIYDANQRYSSISRYKFEIE